MNFIKINWKEYERDMNIIWDELFAYEYEIEEDYWDLDIIGFKYDNIIAAMIDEYYELE